MQSYRTEGYCSISLSCLCTIIFVTSLLTIEEEVGTWNVDSSSWLVRKAHHDEIMTTSEHSAPTCITARPAGIKMKRAPTLARAEQLNILADRLATN
jgi:hypothetical protein